MTTPSLYETIGLSVNFWQPTVAFTPGSPNTVTVTPKGNHRGTLTDTYTSLSYVLNAVGGFWSASITLTDDRLAMEDWLQNGVGLYVEIADPGASVVWAGFVNSLNMNLAGLTITKGPLLDAGNRVIVTYAPVESVPPVEPQLETRTDTSMGEDDDSQRRYGILYAYLSTGGVTAAEADQLRDMFLAENAQPKLSRSLDLSGAPGDSAVTLDCAGYVQMFGQWPYSYTLLSALTNLSIKLASVINADPNGIFSSANASITANTIQVPAWESSQRDAWTILRGLVDLGDVAGNRYLLQVGPDQHVTYEPMPTEAEYHQRITGNRQDIETVGGRSVQPWHVKAGKWVIIPDLLVGMLPIGDLRSDPRAMFIEQLTYTAPWGLSLQGGDADRINQIIARYGLDGTDL